MVTVVDAGVGNLRSLTNALVSLGLESEVRRTPPASRRGAVILPGVGAFGAAMGALEAGGWIPYLREQAERGLPLLGICLGMQLLFEGSEEGPGHEGLGLLGGFARRLDPQEDKVPHIRWARLEFAGGDGGGGRPKWAYFVHSYAVRDLEEETVLARTRHGGAPFPAVVRRGSVVGVQFHPEKSQAQGVAYLGALLGGRP